MQPGDQKLTGPGQPPFNVAAISDTLDYGQTNLPVTATDNAVWFCYNGTAWRVDNGGAVSMGNFNTVLDLILNHAGQPVLMTDSSLNIYDGAAGQTRGVPHLFGNGLQRSDSLFLTLGDSLYTYDCLL